MCVYDRKRERGGREEGYRVMKLERGQEKVKRDLNMGENHEKKQLNTCDMNLTIGYLEQEQWWRERSLG